jgi:hypothetical protein
MAIKTQIRLNQLTASFGGAPGSINDGGVNPSVANKAAFADIAVVDLSGSLSYLATAIRRIHGGSDFSNQTSGLFSHAKSDFTGKIVVGGDTAANDVAAIGYTAAEGIIITGQGSTSDVAIKNDADALVMSIATGTTAVAFEGSVTALSADVVGDVTASTLNADGDTSAGDNAAIGYTAAEGIIITGQGSTNDVTIKNDADVAVVNIPTGGTAVNFVGNVSGSLLKPGADTSAGLGAALGYTAAEGIIITGQGSTNDVTIKNDADVAVVNIPTGGTAVNFAGNLDHADSNWTIGSTMSTSTNKITLGGGAAVEILGDLFVRGTEHIIDTDNLRIKDPVIAMGAGNVAINSNGGIVIISGSSGAAASFAGGNADMVMGRVAVNTWGAGLLDTQSGSITSVTSMGLANMRVRNLELSGSANYLTFATDVKVVSAADIELTAGSLKPAANNGVSLGEPATAFSDLYLASTSVMGWGNGDVLWTHTAGKLTLSGDGAVELDFANHELTNVDIDSGAIDGTVIGNASPAVITGSFITATTSFMPDANDGAVLGGAGLAFSDLFLAEGGVVNWDSGDVTMTQAGNLLTIAGGNTRVDRLELDGATNYLDVDTNLEVVAAANISLESVGDVSLQSGGTNPFLQFNRAGAGEAYLNLSTNDGAGITAGSGGFGFRNTGGTMQFKNNGGAWSSFGASAAASKKTTILTGSVGAGLRLGIDGGFDISGIAGASQSNMIDVFVNGQMMLSGGTYASITNDYAVDVLRGEALSDLRFNFILSDDDVVTVTVR